jgi:uncharacterized protein YqfA (UPF0365 family)
MNELEGPIVPAVLAGIICGMTLLAAPLFVFWLAAPWFKCFLSGGPVSIFQIVGMRLRGTPVALVTNAHLALVQSGQPSEVRHVESTYIANRHRIRDEGDLIGLLKSSLDKTPNAD